MDAERIIGEVAARYNLTADEVKSGKRSRLISEARRFAARRIWEETRLSLREIGRVLGVRGVVRW